MKNKIVMLVMAGTMIVSAQGMGQKHDPSLAPEKKQLGKDVRNLLTGAFGPESVAVAFEKVDDFKRAHPEVNVNDYVGWIDTYGLKRLYSYGPQAYQAFFAAIRRNGFSQEVVDKIDSLLERYWKEKAAYQY